MPNSGTKILTVGESKDPPMLSGKPRQILSVLVLAVKSHGMSDLTPHAKMQSGVRSLGNQIAFVTAPLLTSKASDPQRAEKR
jgi:hypothetical protein